MVKSKKIISILLCMLILTVAFSAALNVSAAKNGTRYYTVTTKANYWYPGSESITVSQAKEVYYSNKARTKTKSRNSLSCTVTCTPTSWSGKKPATIKKTFGGSSKKIELEKNVTYSVEITWKYVICAYNYGTKNEGYAYISNLHKAKIK